MERLENSRWGFESNCFVCEVANPDGLGIEFFADVDDGAVVVDFTLDQRFSGELQCTAEVTDGDGALCATASATFVPLGPAQAVDALGTTVTGDDAGYVRGAEHGEA